MENKQYDSELHTLRDHEVIKCYKCGHYNTEWKICKVPHSLPYSFIFTCYEIVCKDCENGK